MDRATEFETQHKLLLLETLYDAGLSLGPLPDEAALVAEAGHMLPYEQPKAFVDSVSAFLG